MLRFTPFQCHLQHEIPSFYVHVKETYPVFSHISEVAEISEIETIFMPHD